MAIPAMALLQQHDARRDIVIEPAARRRAAIEARGHSEIRTAGIRNWGRNRAVKTHRLVCQLVTACYAWLEWNWAAWMFLGDAVEKLESFF